MAQFRRRDSIWHNLAYVRYGVCGVSCTNSSLAIVDVLSLKSGSAEVSTIQLITKNAPALKTCTGPGPRQSSTKLI
jgi:hypothetical protein